MTFPASDGAACFIARWFALTAGAVPPDSGERPDDRSCWMRDAACVVRVLTESGHTEAACRWHQWLVEALAVRPEQVRVDTTGESADALHVARKNGLASSRTSWRLQRQLTEHLETIWQKPDHGIWQVRGEMRHFTHSKALAWVAFDRAVRAVEEFGLEGPVARWRALRELSIVSIMQLTGALFRILGHDVSWRDLILIGGGLFLLYKATQEIHGRIEGRQGETHAGGRASFAGTVLQIGLLDIVFSLDSVITAVGMSNNLAVMIAAVAIAMAMMLLAAGPVSAFVNRRPTLKMLVLGFLLLIGMTLIADGTGLDVPKGYIYAAIGFSLLVETLNQMAARRVRRQNERHFD